MTKFNELQVSSSKDRKRVGRGIASGQGKTAGRGTKGQGARTGKKLHPMFQGGQRPLAKAVPKARGFKSLRAKSQVVYLDTLSLFAGKTVDNEVLFTNHFVATPFQPVKVILRGNFDAKIDLRVAGASKSVVETITKNGGTFVKTDVPLKQSVNNSKEK